EKFDQGEGALLRWFQTHNFNYYWLFIRIYQLKLGWQLFFKGILKRVEDGLAELFWASWLRKNEDELNWCKSFISRVLRRFFGELEGE
ncbi:MAG: hypothetical protein NTX04_11330, partial [Verrucomicrobia bacterium]|nr:hypothetical protein [Verrucomicrobiota bacterium]